MGFEHTHRGFAGPDAGDLRDPCLRFAGFRIGVYSLWATSRTMFGPPDRRVDNVQLAWVVRAALALAASAGVQRRWPKRAELLAQAEDNTFTHRVFPVEHWTNPLDRPNKEVKRRTNVVGVIPDDCPVTRLVGTGLLEIAGEWRVTGPRRYLRRTTPG